MAVAVGYVFEHQPEAVVAIAMHTIVTIIATRGKVGDQCLVADYSVGVDPDGNGKSISRWVEVGDGS
jgi:hypothetical protein